MIIELIERVNYVGVKVDDFPIEIRTLYYHPIHQHQSYFQGNSKYLKMDSTPEHSLVML
jgi:hypothetical protein